MCIQQAKELRPELLATARMIQAAFPSGVPEAAYRALLLLLYEGLSFRSVAEVVSYCTGKPYAIVYNDVLACLAQGTPGPPGPHDADTVKRVWREHGYEEWLTTPD